MKSGICQICHKEFKLTKFGKLHRHGYKYKIIYKWWQGYFAVYKKAFMALIKQPCKGTGLPPIILKKENK